jgi:hypothetical protein
VLSRTVTEKLQALVLPAASVPVQFTTVVPRANDDPEEGVQRTLTGPSQESDPVALKTTGAAPAPAHSTDKSPGQTNCGAIVSRTVTVKAQALVLPLSSTATQFTVVSPGANSVPEGGEQLTVRSRSQRSVAVAANVTGVPAPAHSNVRLAGQLMTGAVVSTTWTMKLQLRSFPASSMAVQVTVASPDWKTDPDGGTQLTLTLVSQLSVPMAAKATGTPCGSSHSMVRSAGQVMLGLPVSTTRTTNWQEVVLPPSSVTAHWTVV